MLDAASLRNSIKIERSIWWCDSQVETRSDLLMDDSHFGIAKGFSVLERTDLDVPAAAAKNVYVTSE